MTVEKMSTEPSAVTPIGPPGDPATAIMRAPHHAPDNAVEIVKLYKTYRGGNGQADKVALRKVDLDIPVARSSACSAPTAPASRP